MGVVSRQLPIADLRQLREVAAYVSRQRLKGPVDRRHAGAGQLFNRPFELPGAVPKVVEQLCERERMCF